MTPQGFPLYAELWREQIGAEELAELRSMAKTIERGARRRWRLDISLAVGTIALALLFLGTGPSSLPVKLWIVLVGAAVLWAGWRRHAITRASRATAIHEPALFFETAIGNARAEIGLSTTSLILGVPVVILGPVLVYQARGLTSVDLILAEMFEANLAKTIVCGIALVLGYGYFLRENINLREQLRRLERMRREWDE